MKGTNVCLWKIEKNIEEITPLLSNDYSETIQELVAYNNLPEDDKRLVRKWIKAEENGFVKRNLTLNNNEINYIKAIAHMETHSLPKSEIVINGTPLPKDARVNQINSTVIFTNVGQSNYAIIIGSKNQEGRIRSNLMESSKRAESKWGEVSYKDIPQYSFNKSFYYWILKNKGTTLSKNGKTMYLDEVKGFRSDAERKMHSYSGQGSNISDEIPLKSLVSMDETLVSLYLLIRYNNVIYSFYLDHDGRLSVFLPECGEHATENPRQIEADILLLNIYFEIIPFLVSKFNEAIQNGWNNTELEFRKELSIGVIKELMLQNGVSLNELVANLDAAVNN